MVMTTSQSRLLTLHSSFKEFQDFIAFRYDAQKQSVAVRVGRPILAYKIEQIPNQVLKDTKFNYEEAKWFKFKGINVDKRQILIQFRFRKKHWEDALLGRILIYDNAADVNTGLNLEVENRQIKGHPFIHKVNADWASGIGGWATNFCDLMYGTLNWLFTGKFTTITDTILNVGAGFINQLSAFDQINLKEELAELNYLNQNGFIYLDKTEYDNKGVWLVFKLDYSRLDAFIGRLEAWNRGLLNG